MLGAFLYSQILRQMFHKTTKTATNAGEKLRQMFHNVADVATKPGEKTPANVP